MLSLNSVQPFCNSQRTKLHFCYTLEAQLSKSNPLYYGCSNIRHYNRHNNTLLLRCLCLHHRRHLQKSQFLIPNALFPNTPLSPSASIPSINLGVLPDFVRAQIEKMSKIESLLKQICFCLIISISLGLVIFGSSLSAEAHQCNHGHGHDHDHDHQGHHHHHHHHGVSEVKQRKLPEELAEEEDLKLLGFGFHDDVDVHHHHNGDGAKDITGLGLWVNAMGCSLLVSLASLICLIILPVIFLKGKPSKAVVDSLALFGAGAMLGDAFLHQLPHAFGGGRSHSHDHHVEHDHLHDHSGHSHAHSLEDLSVGLSILAGIVLFLIVEKLVRYVEDFSGGADEWSHGHHHHHRHTHITKLKDDDDANDNDQELSLKKSGNLSEKTAGGSDVDGVSADSPNGEKPSGGAVLRKRNTGSSAADDNTVLDAANCSTNSESVGKEQAKSRSSLVFGYLNLFSDGVHNFTDGMALGSAFLLYGSVGGWSRTLFLLAHELPQEIGDFGILVRSGFSVSKALFFNFLSALVALAGTALALTLGQDSGQSSLIEGFTAGGFIYISVAGVLAEMNSSGRTTLMNTVIQLISLISGMAVALCISLVE
ncbi:IAA-alanine resistance protein 1 [Nicotiana sylvestris]|uniref:IAA-alanine resistance protein 1 n=1 Tax=Nicotiana sylvestris TaxID=4096 RepID=A0A1U7XC61_NICSY|nr:PREDICTED: IAA-alanine resistance protein 1 [Nicotiana sylvestris]